VENLLKELSVMKMVGKHVNIISLLGCCTKGGDRTSVCYSTRSIDISFSIGQVMLLVEYAKFGNLRDYLRRKRPAGHVLSGSFENQDDDDEYDSYKQNENDEYIRELSSIDLIVFCLQTASGMEFLHSKKVIQLISSIQMTR
jgi:serine/threonine protein kinase